MGARVFLKTVSDVRPFGSFFVITLFVDTFSVPVKKIQMIKMILEKFARKKA